MDFTVVKVTLTIATSGSVSSDNDKSSNVNGYLGTTSLGGPSISTGSVLPLMRHRVEIKAAIIPANFDKEVVIQRGIVESRSYKGTTPDTRYVICPDTSDDTLLDKTPSSSGNVYDLDAPGYLVQSGSGYPDGTIMHRRTNFRQWLTINQNNGSGTADVVLSDDFTWYQRLSVEKVSSSSQVANGTISGDNIIGTGSTGLDWDLGSGSATGTSSCP